MDQKRVIKDAKQRMFDIFHECNERLIDLMITDPQVAEKKITTQALELIFQRLECMVVSGVKKQDVIDEFIRMVQNC